MTCEKCGTKNKLTTHHIKPRRHFSRAKRSRDVGDAVVDAGVLTTGKFLALK